jgi:bacteriocin-like protein
MKNLQGFNSDEAFQELNAEELASVDGGFFIEHPRFNQPRFSIVLNPADRGRTWGVPPRELIDDIIWDPIKNCDGCGIIYDPRGSH